MWNFLWYENILRIRTSLGPINCKRNSKNRGHCRYISGDTEHIRHITSSHTYKWRLLTMPPSWWRWRGERLFTCLGNPKGSSSFFFFFLGPPPGHMEISRLGVKLELQLQAYATAIALWDPSHVCDLHHSSQQSWILNPLNKDQDRTQVLMDTSQVCFHCGIMWTLRMIFKWWQCH